MEQSLKFLITLCELSNQTLHAHARSDLKAFTDLTLFLPKQIASMEASGATKVRYEDLEVKHMAYLLRRSLFNKNSDSLNQLKKKDIRVSLANIEHRSGSAIW